MFYIILFIIAFYFGYKLRKVIEILTITKNIKYIQFTVDKILSTKDNVKDKFIKKSDISREDLEEFLDYKRKRNCEV